MVILYQYHPYHTSKGASARDSPGYWFRVVNSRQLTTIHHALPSHSERHS
ncbi:hypothetical protein ACR9PT_06655 [Piscirickettsia salmonis]